MTRTTWTVAVFVGLACQALAAPAAANPRPLPFTYQSESLPEGAGEVEQFVDFVPIRALSAGGNPTWYNASQFQTEIEYGLTDRLELALYFTFVPNAGDRVVAAPALTEGNGSKQRVRYRLADPAAWPVDVALYGEVSENEREIELEAKIILQRRFGRLRLMTNLWAEREFYFDGTKEWVLNSTAGTTYEFSPRFHLGFEGWLRAEYPDGQVGGRAFNLGPHVFVGPAFLLNFGRVWWATGAYLRVSNFSR
ncbi:MAG: hypothetical protein QOI66_545, partial [Myxococcales bacterium]|nr:hypothetical protein [Myxococcales bacterium]